MSLDALIMLSGAFVAILPFLGLPNKWDNIIFLVIGIFIVLLGIVVRRKSRNAGKNAPLNPSFVENGPLSHE